MNLTKIDKIIKVLTNKLFLILMVLVLNSCSTVKIAKQDNNSIIAISSSTSKFNIRRNKLKITIQNIETQEIYTSTSLSPNSRHSIIQNIPSGRYEICKVEVPERHITYSNWAQSVIEYFGQINIEPNSKYYLGDFSVNIDIEGKYFLRLKITNENIPGVLKEKIENKKTGWRNGEFIKCYPYEKKELLLDR